MLVEQLTHHLVVEALVEILYLAQSPLMAVLVAVVTQQERAAQTAMPQEEAVKEIQGGQVVLVAHTETQVVMGSTVAHILAAVVGVRALLVLIA